MSLSISKVLRVSKEYDSRLGIADGRALLTHYLQSSSTDVGRHFENGAHEVWQKIVSLMKTPLSIQPRLPILWDVPFPPSSTFNFRFIDLFAGIGGMRLAFEAVGGRCVFSSEWNRFAQFTYESNFGETPFGDITRIDDAMIPEHDILVAGFPCQPFSIAGVTKKNSLGRSHGFDDETQGTLFFDVARVLRSKRPAAFLLENVKNLRTHDKGNTFKVITETLRELDYRVFCAVLDGQNFVPQHRERIFIVGFDTALLPNDFAFQFPTMPKRNVNLNDLLEETPLEKYTLSDHLWTYLQDYAEKHKLKGNGFGFGLVDLTGITRTLSARYYKDGAEILIPQKGKNPRRLTPREAARLQGFPDEFVIPVSDTQAYKQFGNSVVVPLVTCVAEKIAKTLNALSLGKGVCVANQLTTSATK